MKIVFEIDIPEHDNTAAMADTLLNLMKLLGQSAANANCAVALTVDGRDVT